MSGVCVGAVEVLVRVFRFDVKVGGDAVVVVKRNSNVKDVEEVSLVNLMVGCMWLSVVMKSVSLSCLCVQIKDISSIKRYHERGLWCVV